MPTASTQQRTALPKTAKRLTHATKQTADDPRHGPHRWTREEYHRAIAAGTFNNVRVELLDGEIWNMPAQLTPHATSVRKTVLALRDIFGRGFIVDSQLPIATAKWSEPEPDVAVIVGTPDDYEDDHPGPDEILLLVEISDTSLRKDRGRKKKSYAQAGISEYWIVNLVKRHLEVYRQPTPDGLYLEAKIFRPSEIVETLAAPGDTITVSTLMPRTEKP